MVISSPRGEGNYSVAAALLPREGARR